MYYFIGCGGRDPQQNFIIHVGPLGLGPLGQKVAKNAFSWHPSGEHLVCGLFERHIGTLQPKKVPKRKTCQILRKRVIYYYLLLNFSLNLSILLFFICFLR